MARSSTVVGVVAALALACSLGSCGSSEGAAGQTTGPLAPTTLPDTTATSSTTSTLASTTTAAPLPSSTTSSTYPPTTQPAAAPGTAATDPEVGWSANWELDPAYPVRDTDTSIHVRLWPPECADGQDQQPLRAGVRQVGSEVRITVDLAPLAPGTFGKGRTCVDVQFPTVVELDGPVDGRALVDATCLLGGNRTGPNPHELCVQRPGR